MIYTDPGKNRRVVVRVRQSGFTITELLVTSALSLGVVSSVLIGYLAVYTGAADILAASKLHQDLNAVMSLMITELRRAGFSADPAAAGDPTANAFNRSDGTALAIFDNPRDNQRMAARGSGSCAVYAYDRDQDGEVDDDELGGFRLTRGAVQLRLTGRTTNPGTCASAGNSWTSLTDPAFMTVTDLIFDLGGSTCLNTREPDGVNNDPNEDIDTDEADEADCYDTAPGSGDITVETRLVAITLVANLRTDPQVRQAQTWRVRVRNDLVRRR